MLINPYRIGHGPCYVASGAARQGPCRNYAIAGLTESKKRRRGGRQVKWQRELWKGRRTFIKVGTLNIGKMTGRERDLADMMEQRNVDILIVLTENKVERK